MSAILSVGLYDVVNWVGEVSNYHPNPARMHQTQQTMEAEFNRQQQVAMAAKEDA